MHESQPKKVKVKRGVSGLGLFANEFIRKGDHIIDYVGERITSEEADRRSTRYLFELDDDYTIDGSSRSNVARYVNHFCDPNVEAEVMDGRRIRLSALRDIFTGEELGYDYGEEYVAEFITPKGCKCPSCR